MSDLDAVREAVRVLEEGGWTLYGNDVRLIEAALACSGLPEQVDKIRARAIELDTMVTVANDHCDYWEARALAVEEQRDRLNVLVERLDDAVGRALRLSEGDRASDGMSRQVLRQMRCDIDTVLASSTVNEEADPDDFMQDGIDGVGEEADQ